MDRCLGSEAEGIDETLDSLSDEIMCANEKETCPGWRTGMVVCFSFKELSKVEWLFLEDEKTLFTLNTFFVVVYFFDAKGSMNDSVDDVVIILGKQGVNACFAFEVNDLLDEEGLGKVKHETLDSILKEDRC